MIFALLAVLSARPALAFLYWGTPVAYLLATTWTVFRLRQEIAEVWILPGAAGIRTLWEVARQQPIEEWQPVLQVKRTRQGLQASIGWSVLEFHEDDWPEFDALKTALRQALPG